MAARVTAYERLRRDVETQDWGARSPALAVTISAEVVTTRPDKSFEQAVARAEVLLHFAKREGRNHVIGGSPGDE
jgi:PleD family two-component response regulator